MLVAEDDAIIRLDLRTLLEANAHEVCGEARDGLEAVELALSLEPDVIVMDLRMPRLDGIDAASRILERRSVPIVMLTGYGGDDLVERAVEAGVFGFLSKPFHADDLVSALRTARARHSEVAELKLQNLSLYELLEARKIIERAKGILMAREGISEQEALTRLRRASQNTGRPMKTIAEAVTAALG